MARALLILGWLATAGLTATGLLGFGVTPASGLGTHLLIGLLSSLLLLFSHCWIMFYLIGTGKAIKSAVLEHDLEPDIVEQTRDFKNRSYPWLMLAMALVMATFILGGGVATRVLPPWTHSLLFAVALVAQVRTLLLEGEILMANERLMQAIDRRIAADAPPGSERAG